MGNKNEGQENKTILGDFNCAMYKMDRYDGNKIQRHCRCCSNYVLIMYNGFEDQWRRENQRFP